MKKSSPKTGDNLSHPHCCRIGRCKTGAITPCSWSRFAAEESVFLGDRIGDRFTRRSVIKARSQGLMDIWYMIWFIYTKRCNLDIFQTVINCFSILHTKFTKHFPEQKKTNEKKTQPMTPNQKEHFPSRRASPNTWRTSKGHLPIDFALARETVLALAMVNVVFFSCFFKNMYQVNVP